MLKYKNGYFSKKGYGNGYDDGEYDSGGEGSYGACGDGVGDGVGGNNHGAGSGAGGAYSSGFGFCSNGEIRNSIHFWEVVMEVKNETP